MVSFEGDKTVKKCKCQCVYRPYYTKSFYVTNKLYMPNSSFNDRKQKSKQNITRFYILTCALTSKTNT